MRKLALLIIVGLVAITNYAQTKNFIDQPYIDTTAKVDTLIVPDLIYVTIVLQEEDSKGKISLEKLESNMEKALKSVGVNIKNDLQVSEMSSAFKKYFLKEKEILKSKSFSLLLHDSKTANSAFLALEKSGISNVFLEKTAYSKMDELQLQLKSLAIRKAKEQAIYLTEPLGQYVGKAIYIMDRNQQYNKHRSYELEEVVSFGYTAGDQTQKPIEIDFQAITIETTVTVKFKLE